MRRTNRAPALTTATVKEFAMPNARTSGAVDADQAMTIPERIAAALKAAGRFEVGSTVYLPDRDQTLRVVKLDFTSGKKGKKGVWLRWESKCVDCGKPYQFTTKRSFAYPTRTCPEHRKVGARPVAAQKVSVAFDDAMRKAAIDVLNGFSLVEDVVLIDDVRREIMLRLYGEVLPPRDPRGRGIWPAIAQAIEDGEAPGVIGDHDILFCPPLS